MIDQTENDEEMSISLAWPADDLELREHDHEDAALSAIDPSVLAATPPTIDGGDGLEAAISSVSVRLEAMAAASTSLRRLVTDRLSDYSQQLREAVSASATTIEDYQQQHERALTELRQGVWELKDALPTGSAGGDQAIDTLSRRLQHLDDALAHRLIGLQENQLETLALTHTMLERMDHLAEELSTLKRRVGLRARPQGLAPDQVDAIVDAVVERLHSTVPAPSAPERPDSGRRRTRRS